MFIDFYFQAWFEPEFAWYRWLSLSRLARLPNHLVKSSPALISNIFFEQKVSFAHIRLRRRDRKCVGQSPTCFAFDPVVDVVIAGIIFFWCT